MSQISVGINDNLVISKAVKNDRGTLIITLKETTEIDPMAALNSSGSTNFEKAERDVMIYPPNLKAYGSEEVDTIEKLFEKIAEIKNPLHHIVEQYLPNNKINWGDLFEGTKINPQDQYKDIQNEKTLTRVYDNIVNAFIKMMTPFMSDNGKKMRVLLIRTSAAKHYPTFRKRFLEGQPFIEPMDVPVSKLKFSTFEINKGLNKGDTVTGQQVITQEEKDQVETLFTTN